MKLGEAVYKNQQDQPKDDKNDKGLKVESEKDNVVDADFEDVKEDKEKAPKIKKEQFLVAKRDYYEILGVQKSASKDEIKGL